MQRRLFTKLCASLLPAAWLSKAFGEECGLSSSEDPESLEGIQYWITGSFFHGFFDLALFLNIKQDTEYVKRVILADSAGNTLRGSYFTRGDQDSQGMCPMLAWSRIRYYSESDMFIWVLLEKGQDDELSHRVKRFHLTSKMMKRSSPTQLAMPEFVRSEIKLADTDQISYPLHFRVKEVAVARCSQEQLCESLGRRQVPWKAEKIDENWMFKVDLSAFSDEERLNFRYALLMDPVGRVLGLTKVAGRLDFQIKVADADNKAFGGAKIVDCSFVYLIVEDLRSGFFQRNISLV